MIRNYRHTKQHLGNPTSRTGTQIFDSAEGSTTLLDVLERFRFHCASSEKGDLLER